MNLEEPLHFTRIMENWLLLPPSALAPALGTATRQLKHLWKAPAWTRLDQRGLLRHRTGFSDLIAGDSTILEREPLEQAARMGVNGFQAWGFGSAWTLRDHIALRKCGGREMLCGNCNYAWWSLVEPVLSVTTCWLQS